MSTDRQKDVLRPLLHQHQQPIGKQQQQQQQQQQKQKHLNSSQQYNSIKQLLSNFRYWRIPKSKLNLFGVP